MWNVKFKNNYGNEFILTEEEAERQILQWKISFKQIEPIVEIKEEIVEKIDLNNLTSAELQVEYFDVFWKEVPVKYKNNIEWIKNKLVTK